MNELYFVALFASFTSACYGVSQVYIYSRYYSKSWLDTLHAALLYSIIPLIFLTIFKYGASQ